MRIELSGSLIRPDPLVIKFNASQTFDVQKYLDQGYTHFDVICVGGGGGMGGGIDTGNAGTLVRNYGGAGGGGGFHRVHGLLSALPSTCPVVVGAGGAVGTENNGSNPALTTDGGDGGLSSFNDTTCRASGGKGGKRARTNDLITRTQADGGEGGLGNRMVAGGGAAGGISGTPTATGPGTPGSDGADGTLFQNVGKGGGGGAGGVGKYGGITCNAATAGGRGSYNPGDTSVYGPGDAQGNDSSSGAQNIVPGGASGAKAAPVNGLPTVYGQSKGERLAGDPGTVILRLIAK
jgi:hypothetical protein